MGKGKACTGFWWGNLSVRDHLRDPGMDWKIIFIWMFIKSDWGYGVDRAGSGQGQVVNTCECSNKSSGFIKFLE
jgi:hypothetical protein